VETEELDISSISLAKVTEEYLARIAVLEHRDAPEMADFLVVATKLLVLKSGLLLPELAVEAEPGFDLALQLRLYRDFLQGAKKIDALWKRDQRLYARVRPYVFSSAPKFLPPAEANTSVLADCFRLVINRLKPLLLLPETEMRRVVSLSERMHELEELLFAKKQLRFREFLGTESTKSDVIVSFLALLELVRARVLSVEQRESFNDITIHALTEELNPAYVSRNHRDH
jgi:segregation and condensation protein A